MSILLKLFLTLDGNERKTDFRSRDIAKNNFSGIDISQGLDLERPSLSPYFLLFSFMKLFLGLIHVQDFLKHLGVISLTTRGRV